MRATGFKRPSPLASLYYWLVFFLRRQCRCRVEVGDERHRYVFNCDSLRALRRATTLFVKEAGTVDWLQRELRAGDVFLDIGANIGIYSLIASHLVGPEGRVFAIEPHAINAVALLENVSVNGMAGRVSVLTVALSDKTGFDQFNYHDWEAAYSHSQFGRTVDETGRDFVPVCTEVKYGTTVDALVKGGVLPPPNAVKIDVDGLEPGVLEGMTSVLTGSNRPRSVQVEVGPATMIAVDEHMTAVGYCLDCRHHTTKGKRRIRAGAAETAVAHNAVYKLK